MYNFRIKNTCTCYFETFPSKSNVIVNVIIKFNRQMHIVVISGSKDFIPLKELLKNLSKINKMYVLFLLPDNNCSSFA